MNFLQRVTNWKSTTAGVGISAAFMVLFNSLGCQAPDNPLVYAVGILPAVLGAFSTDGKK